MVLFVMPLVPIVPLVKPVGLIGRTLNAHTVLFTVIVGQLRVSDRGQTKCRHCIVISEKLGSRSFDTEGSD